MYRHTQFYLLHPFFSPLSVPFEELTVYHQQVIIFYSFFLTCLLIEWHKKDTAVGSAHSVHQHKINFIAWPLNAVAIRMNAAKGNTILPKSFAKFTVSSTFQDNCYFFLRSLLSCIRCVRLQLKWTNEIKSTHTNLNCFHWHATMNCFACLSMHLPSLEFVIFSLFSFSLFNKEFYWFFWIKYAR